MKSKQIRQPTRVIVVDDHIIFRQSLKLLLSGWADIDVVADTCQAGECLQLVDTLHPSVAVLDITMPDKDGLELAREIRERAPQTHILILSMHNKARYAFQAMKIGCRGYILKSDTPDQLETAVRSVAEGQTYISPSLMTDFISYCMVCDFDPVSPISHHTPLTARESEICDHVLQGHSTKQMAEELFISPKTVRVHVANAMKKLSCDTRTELVRKLWAMKNP